MHATAAIADVAAVVVLEHRRGLTEMPITAPCATRRTLGTEDTIQGLAKALLA
jgi:hypothetical protein